MLLAYLYEEPSLWENIYSSMLQQISRHFKINETLLKTTLKELHEQKLWVIKEALPKIEKKTHPNNRTFNCILYDIYSSKTNPELWSYDYLAYFLKYFMDKKNCIFRSYASQFQLKKALKEQGFKLIKSTGFDYKRESTKAIKNC